jgi:post-segregation antitoxin (ccd killing protein)
MAEPLRARSFKPWPENQERLELADKLGINVSELINEALQRAARKIMEEKTKQLREALSVPIP